MTSHVYSCISMCFHVFPGSWMIWILSSEETFPKPANLRWPRRASWNSGQDKTFLYSIALWVNWTSHVLVAIISWSSSSLIVTEIYIDAYDNTKPNLMVLLSLAQMLFACPWFLSRMPCWLPWSSFAATTCCRNDAPRTPYVRALSDLNLVSTTKQHARWFSSPRSQCQSSIY